MTTLSHLFPIKILPEAIDFMGHVNNSRYLNWVQEAVLEHWRNLAPPEAVAQRAWVALKHEITYRKPSFLGDAVVATVLLEKVQGARAFYERLGAELLIEQPFQESLAHNVMPGVLGVTKVEFISPDPDWWWKGTTALALEQIHLQGA